MCVEFLDHLNNLNKKGEMYMLIVEAYYRVKPGKRDELIKIAQINIDATRKEVGNITYNHYPSSEDTQGMFVFEIWENEEVFNYHPKTEHHKQFCMDRRPLIEPNSYKITMYNAEVNEERTNSARAFATKNID